MTYHIFVGFDSREKEAFQVCKYSLEKHASVPIKVHKLEQKDLRDKNLFTRPHIVQGVNGQYIDAVDGRPFSTQFTFTRFLVPELWRELDDPDKSPLVMFVDSDFLYLDDIGDMFRYIEDKKLKNQGKPPVYCTKHDYNPNSTIKMDGVAQSKYNMKLWAAMMVFDMEHPDNKSLTPDTVNNEYGRNLMTFCWVKNVHRIEHVPERWHFIPNHSEKNTSDSIAAIHFTEGAPSFKGYREGSYAKKWFDVYNDYLKNKLKKERRGLEEICDTE